MKFIGMIGLGNMGRGMALSLQRAGFQVIGTARSQSTRQRLASQGIHVEDTVAAVMAKVEAVIVCLPMPADVVAVVEGPGGVLENAKPGLLVIDTSTTDPETTRRLAGRLEATGASLIDAPVSGGPARALDGTLTMMIGCSDEAWPRAEPILQAMSAKQIRVGAVGAGQVAKLANNLLLASHLAVAAEVMHMANASGVSVEKVLDAVNSGTGRSQVTENNFRTWILNNAFNSGFTMALMRKDVRLSAQLMSSLGLGLPVTGAVAQCWSDSAQHLADGEDFNRIVEMASNAKTRPSE